MTTPVVGHDIDAWCNKCKLILAHVVVALVDERPHRVQCKTCQAVHVYRENEPAKTQKTTTRRRRSDESSEYDRRMRGRDLTKASPYRVTSTYAEDEIIEHKTLGIGLVTELIGTDKLKVLFSNGPKRLVCGR